VNAIPKKLTQSDICDDLQRLAQNVKGCTNLYALRWCLMMHKAARTLHALKHVSSGLHGEKRSLPDLVYGAHKH